MLTKRGLFPFHLSIKALCLIFVWWLSSIQIFPYSYALAPSSGLPEGDKTAAIQKKIDALFVRYRASRFIPGHRAYYRSVRLPGIELHVVEYWHLSDDTFHILHDQIVPLVLQAPDQWLFIVEMQTAEERQAFEESRGRLELYDETDFTKDMADLLSIPISSPVLGIYNRRVVEEAQRRGTEPAVIAKRAFLEIHTLLRKGGQSLTGDSVERVVRDFTLRWKMDRDWLRQICHQAVQEAIEREKIYPNQEVDYLSQVAFLLADIANEFMHNELTKILDDNVEKKKRKY